MKVSITFPKVRVNPNAIAPAKILKLCKEECTNTLARLRQAVGSGKGADGQNIKPGGYSPEYAIRKAEGKVQGGTRGTGAKGAKGVPNLTVTGDLLGSEQVRASPDGKGAEIYLNGGHYSGISNAQLMAHHISKGFEGVFEFGQTDIQRVEKRADQLLEEVAKTLIEGI